MAHFAMSASIATLLEYFLKHNSQIIKKFYEEMKDKLVTYFKNKERVLPVEQKNETIYTGSVEDAYNCIVDLHASHSNHLFVLYILILIQLLANFLFLGDNIFLSNYFAVYCLYGPLPSL